jgi:isopentenyl phosphate kinase
MAEKSELSDLIFLKLGGSLITDKAVEGSFREPDCRRLGAEIRDALASTHIRVVLGHGGGSIAHGMAQRYRTVEGLAGGGGWKGYAETRRAVVDLNRRVLNAFAESEFRPVSVAPSSVAVASGGRMKQMDMTIIEALLEKGQAPLIFGDALVDDQWGFTICSTEAIFEHMAERLRPTRVLFACDVDGVFAGNPIVNPDARRIATITPANLEQIRGQIRRDGRADVTGGMSGKIDHLMRIAAIPSVREVRIFSGLVPDAVRKALLGKIDHGTVVKLTE